MFNLNMQENYSSSLNELQSFDLQSDFAKQPSNNISLLLNFDSNQQSMSNSLISSQQNLSTPNFQINAFNNIISTNNFTKNNGAASAIKDPFDLF